MSAIHPYDLYKMNMSVRLHFTNMKFDYYTSSTPNIRYSNFYNTKNHINYMSLSKRWSKEFAEEIFVSNLLKDTSVQIYQLDGVTASTIRSEWLKRLHNIPFNFNNDVKILCERNNINDFEEMKDKMENIPKGKQKLKSGGSVTNIVLNRGDSFYSDFVSKISPESSVIINSIFYRKYHFNFLLNAINNKFDYNSRYLVIYKYTSFLDIDYLLKEYKSIRKFYNAI